MNEETELKIEKILSLAFRIHRETSLCSFFSYSGHVDRLTIDVREAKDQYLKKFHSAEIRLCCFEFEDKEKFQNELKDNLDTAIAGPESILSKDWDYSFEAYCNLTDMSCSDIFSTEEAAKKWVSKMERRYKSVHPYCGYKKEMRQKL